MVKAMYAGVAGLRAHQSKMDVIGNNIANVNTWGYKSMNTSFKESIYQSLVSASGGGSGDGSYGGVNPSMVGYGSMVSAITANFTSGTPSYTGQGLDCYIDGASFFAVGPMYGDSDAKTADDINLSRVGNFGVINGYLVDANGRYVYGFNIDGGVAIPSEKQADGTWSGANLESHDFDATKGSYSMQADTTEMKPIKIPDKITVNGATEDLKINSWSVDSTGKIYGTSTTGKTVLLGSIALVSVVNPNGLTKQDGPYYKSSDASGDSTIIEPGGAAGSLQSGYLESANVDIANEFSEMITTQRGFQANSRIITVSDTMLEELVNLKR